MRTSPTSPVTSRASNFFRCRPGESCRSADCCRHSQTNPTLSLADYMELARVTGRSMADIWRKEGNVHLVPFPNQPGYFSIMLGLLHDPCPFLIEDRCIVYAGQPLECSLFPLPIGLRSVAEICMLAEIFPCISGLTISESQKQLLAAAQQLTTDAAILGNHKLWGNQRIKEKIPGINDARQFLGNTVSEVREIDPQGEDPRAARVFSAAREYDGKVRVMEAGGARVTLDDIFIALTPIWYYALRDEIAARLSKIDRNPPSGMRNIMQRRNSLRAELRN